LLAPAPPQNMHRKVEINHHQQWTTGETMRPLPRSGGRDSNWGSGVASAIAAAVALIIVGLLLMDTHLSRQHVYHISGEQAAADRYVVGGHKSATGVGLAGGAPTTGKGAYNSLAPGGFDPSAPPQKIAYIFAGSARSFVCPQVHWSIKANLIDALGGEPHSFVRMSLEDNRNVKTGSGIIFKLQVDEREVDETLKILNPDIVERFSYSEQVEEMKRLYPQPIHTVFRENDQRRYSMFYHRCRAYELMLRYEKEHNVRFDWVVLGRVDAGWLEPILPIEAYDNDRVWITETGYDRFNDQFMLIPRQFSDYLYDLNTKVKQGVYCLGGPDVETWKCNTTALRERGVSEEKIQSVLPYCCPDILNRDTNHIGRSERIHYKHLEAGQIPLGIGRFPTFLTRRMQNGECVGECFRIYAYHYKEYVFRFASAIYPHLMPTIWPDTRGRSISARDRNLCYALKEQAYPWHPITLTDFHDTIRGRDKNGKVRLQNLLASPTDPISGYQVDYSLPLHHPAQKLHASIPLNPKDTEMWRIHPTWNVEGCLTFSYKTKELLWEACKGHCLAKSNTFMPNQLFFLYVVPERPAALKHLPTRSYHAPSWFPDSTYDAAVGNVTRLMTLNSEPNNLDYRSGMLCLTAQSLTLKAPIKMALCNRNANDPLQALLTVRAVADGSHPQSTTGQLRFSARPDLCVARSENKEVDRSVYPETNELFVFLCDWKAHFHKNTFEFELIGS
jgi:hypothetical protein